MTSLWRISNHSDLVGLGGERADGRWHTAAPGKRIVYLSEHPAVALLESLANLKGNPALFPDKYQLLQIEVPAELYRKVKPLLDDKGRALTQTQSRQAGDQWLRSKTSALVAVPSIPSPHSTNILLNPLHPDAAKLHITGSERLQYDKRLFHRPKP